MPGRPADGGGYGGVFAGRKKAASAAAEPVAPQGERGAGRGEPVLSALGIQLRHRTVRAVLVSGGHEDGGNGNGREKDGVDR